MLHEGGLVLGCGGGSGLSTIPPQERGDTADPSRVPETAAKQRHPRGWLGSCPPLPVPQRQDGGHLFPQRFNWGSNLHWTWRGERFNHQECGRGEAGGSGQPQPFLRRIPRDRPAHIDSAPLRQIMRARCVPSSPFPPPSGTPSAGTRRPLRGAQTYPSRDGQASLHRGPRPYRRRRPRPRALLRPAAHNAMRPAPRPLPVEPGMSNRAPGGATRRSTGGACAHGVPGELRHGCDLGCSGRAGGEPGVSRRETGPDLGRCPRVARSSAPSEPARASGHGLPARQGRLSAEPGQEDLLPARPRAAPAQAG